MWIMHRVLRDGRKRRVVVRMMRGDEMVVAVVKSSMLLMPLPPTWEDCWNWVLASWMV
jgi:hypothetical protein